MLYWFRHKSKDGGDEQSFANMSLYLRSHAQHLPSLRASLIGEAWQSPYRMNKPTFLEIISMRTKGTAFWSPFKSEYEQAVYTCKALNNEQSLVRLDKAFVILKSFIGES